MFDVRGLIGQDVEVCVRNNWLGLVVHMPALSVHVGKIVENFAWQPSDEIAMTAPFPVGFIRQIRMRNIVSIRRADGTDVAQHTAARPQQSEWLCEGSKGRQYVVSRMGAVWKCTCPAGQFNRQCRHVNEIKGLQ